MHDDASQPTSRCPRDDIMMPLFQPHDVCDDIAIFVTVLMSPTNNDNYLSTHSRFVYYLIYTCEVSIQYASESMFIKTMYRDFSSF
jgi:hypothetical protein